MLKRFITFFVITIFVLVLSACGGKTENNNTEKTGVTYEITYKDYVGVATVKVKNKEVVDASFEEYFLPNTWAKLKVNNSEEVPSDVVADKSAWFGKFLVIGDKRFTGELREEPLVHNGSTLNSQSVKYSAEGISDLYLWLAEKEENRKWYVEQLDGDNVFVATSEFEKLSHETAGLLTSEEKLGFKKSATNYWKGEHFPLGWSGNMAEIVNVIKGTKMTVTMDSIVQNDDNKWVVNGVVSGATIQSFKDYYALAQTAYNRAV